MTTTQRLPIIRGQLMKFRSGNAEGGKLRAEGIGRGVKAMQMVAG
jgi:hypothetical protein